MLNAIADGRAKHLDAERAKKFLAPFAILKMALSKTGSGDSSASIHAIGMSHCSFIFTFHDVYCISPYVADVESRTD